MAPGAALHSMYLLAATVLVLRSAAVGGDDSAPADTHLSAQMMTAGAGAAAGAAAAMGSHSKFFQYGHHDGKDHYEFGYRRGNEHHFQERHEKGAPKHGHVTAKVRWGDKHGGYGEHYWDYNHGGHHDGDGGGEGSAPVPQYSANNMDGDRSRNRDDAHSQFKRQSQSGSESMELDGVALEPQPQRQPQPQPEPQRQLQPQRQLHQPHPQPQSQSYRHAESSNAAARLSSSSPLVKRGARPATVSKQVPVDFFPAGGFFAASPQSETPVRAVRQAGVARRLVLDPTTGLVHDEGTGKTYRLQEVS